MVISMSNMFTSHNYINIFLIWIAIYIVLLSRSIIYNVYHDPVYYFYTIPLKVITVFYWNLSVFRLVCLCNNVSDYLYSH